MSSLKVTIFIPTWFGERYLEEILKAIFTQKVDFAYEVLIFDTSSTDRTVDIIKKYQKIHKNLRFKSIAKDEFGHGKTRNAAAYEAKGEFIVYLTHDATPAHEYWLKELIAPFDISEKIVAVMGKQYPRPHCIPMLKSEINGTFRNLGPDFGTSLFYKDNFIQDQATYDAVRFYSDVNSAARVQFVRNVVPYRDVPYAEDQLFGEDVINSGYLKAYAPRAAVIHSNDLTLREYAKRMFDETYGLRKIGTPVPVPPLLLIAKMVGRGIVRDWRNILKDSNYSTKRKLYWIFVNPLFHIEKWRGLRRATKADIKDTEAARKHSLEETKHA